ncbi:hypothetical protein CA85_44470 [Allorhodopirellula solitaria]|uniref:Transposase IS200-like domain-containing protein n=2 Tax=Allorhodopirellula solitaria TaxID=2527987 RepID=A0A5C5X277_9BACT|nr:hypothetical protein CA85_44470 [Allorhodopirellula solitaria]
MIGELFDPNAEFSIRETCKPHWSQAGAVVFITFRTADSIPKEVIHRWHREKCDWLVRRGYMRPEQDDWKQVVEEIPSEEAHQFRRQFLKARESCLDDCHGRCVLRDPQCSGAVADSLLKFDGDRYSMGDFVVMPNHVHFLAAFATEQTMGRQCTSWMHYTAHIINGFLDQSCRFWQPDPFDHLVRSPE